MLRVQSSKMGAFPVLLETDLERSAKALSDGMVLPVLKSSFLSSESGMINSLSPRLRP